MHDFRCCDAKDMYFKEMQEVTHHFKETEEGVEYMCRAFEETRNEKAIWIAKNLIEAGKMTFEEIAKAWGLCRGRYRIGIYSILGDLKQGLPLDQSGLAASPLPLRGSLWKGSFTVNGKKAFLLAEAETALHSQRLPL